MRARRSGSALMAMLVVLAVAAVAAVGAWALLRTRDLPQAQTPSVGHRTSLGVATGSPGPAGTPVPAVTVSISPDYREARTTPTDCVANLARPGGVLLIGDSLTVGAAQKVTQSMADAGVPLCLDAVVGRNAGEGNAVLHSLLEKGVLRPDTLVVMAFGANDATKGAGWGACQATRALHQVGRDRLVVWVNGYNAMSPAAAAGQERFNKEVGDVASGTDRLGLIDWHEAAGASEDVIGPDRVHPTDAGRVAWTRLITTGVLDARAALRTGGEVTPRCDGVATTDG